MNAEMLRKQYEQTDDLLDIPDNSTFRKKLFAWNRNLTRLGLDFLRIPRIRSLLHPLNRRQLCER